MIKKCFSTAHSNRTCVTQTNRARGRGWRSLRVLVYPVHPPYLSRIRPGNHASGGRVTSRRSNHIAVISYSQAETLFPRGRRGETEKRRRGPQRFRRAREHDTRAVDLQTQSRPAERDVVLSSRAAYKQRLYATGEGVVCAIRQSCCTRAEFARIVCPRLFFTGPTANIPRGLRPRSGGVGGGGER